MRKLQLFENLSKIQDVVLTLDLISDAGGLESAIDAIVNGLKHCREKRGKVWLIGNGGSAAVALHIANDLNRSSSLFASSLSEFPTATAISNDVAYTNIYSIPLSKAIRAEDLVIGISSSGKSLNIINGIIAVADSGCATITLTGMKSTNELAKRGAINIFVDFEDYGSIEVAHLAILHSAVSNFISE